MKSIRVAVDLTPMLVGGANGGVKPAILAFLQALQKWQNPQFSFCFITSGGSHDEIRSITSRRDEAICIDSLPAENPLQPSFFTKKSINILYAPFGMIRFPECGIPIVSMVVDLLHRDYPQSISQEEREWRETYFERTASLSNRFQVISDYTGERLTRHYGVPEAKIFRTYLPIQDRLEAREKVLSLSNPYFFYPANFWPHKNHQILLLAYQIYRNWAGVHSWDLVLTGSQGAERIVMGDLVKVLGIENQVIFRGYLPEIELAAVYALASGLVFPSLHEGFGIPPLEAMKLRVPVISSDAGSLKEVVGTAGLLVDPRKPLELAEAMLKLASSKVLQAELRKRGENHVKTFVFLEEVAKLAEVFEREALTARRLTPSERFWRNMFLLKTNGYSWSRSAIKKLRSFLRARL